MKEGTHSNLSAPWRVGFNEIFFSRIGLKSNRIDSLDLERVTRESHFPIGKWIKWKSISPPAPKEAGWGMEITIGFKYLEMYKTVGVNRAGIRAVVRGEFCRDAVHGCKQCASFLLVPSLESELNWFGIRFESLFHSSISRVMNCVVNDREFRLLELTDDNTAVTRHPECKCRLAQT